MTPKIDKLIRMANQIADFFGPYPDEEAAAGIHEHLTAFWTRGMLEELAAFVEAGGSGVQPRVLLAMQRFGEESSPIHKAVAGPEEVGQATSDAG
jgi:formate dehydrogenase subunit delta